MQGHNERSKNEQALSYLMPEPVFVAITVTKGKIDEP